MFRETTIETYNLLDPEWDDVSRIIDFSNCWDNDIPTGDYLPTHHLALNDLRSKPPPRIWPQPWREPLKKRQEPPKPRRILLSDQHKMLWWRHEMQEIPEEALARIYNFDPIAVHEAIRDEWAVIYEFWGGTPEEFRAEMRKPENIDKRRA
jgi:hypothetical protein